MPTRNQAKKAKPQQETNYFYAGALVLFGLIILFLVVTSIRSSENASIQDNLAPPTKTNTDTLVLDSLQAASPLAIGAQ